MNRNLERLIENKKSIRMGYNPFIPGDPLHDFVKNFYSDQPEQSNREYHCPRCKSVLIPDEGSQYCGSCKWRGWVFEAPSTELGICEGIKFITSEGVKKWNLGKDMTKILMSCES